MNHRTFFPILLLAILLPVAPGHALPPITDVSQQHSLGDRKGKTLAEIVNPGEVKSITMIRYNPIVYMDELKQRGRQISGEILKAAFDSPAKASQYGIRAEEGETTEYCIVMKNGDLFIFKIFVSDAGKPTGIILEGKDLTCRFNIGG